MKKYLITLIEPDDILLSLNKKQIDYLFNKINWKLFCKFRIEYEKLNYYERKEKKTG